MYKRLELHNHTTESDSRLTCQELLEYMEKDQVDAFAITDHNTISGHNKIKKLLQERNTQTSCIYGMEYTTYYGHILCLNLKEYVPWETINRHHPELLFQAVQDKGALAGIAHPYSYGDPFARGCRFEMQIHDYNAVDFIEIFNNPEPLHEVNEPALLLWENLVLSGHKLAMTCGMDLHGRWDMHMQFATFIPGTKDGDVTQELIHAIQHQQTCISKGPIIEASLLPAADVIQFTIVNTDKPGYHKMDTSPYLLKLRTQSKEWIEELADGQTLQVPLCKLGGDIILLSRLYQTSAVLENLDCVGAPLYL